MAANDRLYPPIDPYALEPPQFGDDAACGGGGGGGEVRVRDPSAVMWDKEPEASPSSPEEPVTEGTHTFEQGPKVHLAGNNVVGSAGVGDVYEYSREMTTMQELVENTYYDCALRDQTGMWVPPSVPPMTKHDHEEWQKGFGANGGYFAEEDLWDIDEENKEMTMWDVLAAMVSAGKDKVLSVVSYDFGRQGMSLISHLLLEEACKDKADTLEDASVGLEHALLEAEPTVWLPDSAAPSCMLCGARFHPIICSRHHCRFCGGLFCGGCSKGRSLMPPKFSTSEPQRVCDVCGVRLECIQPYLMNKISRACQIPTNDLTDLSTLRSWLNLPWARTMEYEIYKAVNSIYGYFKLLVRSVILESVRTLIAFCVLQCNFKVGSLKPEKSIPDSILRQAKGLAIITVVNVGMMVTYKIGTGLVVARRADGSWSPPSAISTYGVGYGVQAGGELADYIIVLRNTDAIRTFSGNAHLSVGAGISASAGHLGRVAEADFRAGDGGYAACYTYSCSKGAFVGCALNGSVVSTRHSANAQFYGGPIKASEILLGSVSRPAAAATLYRALSKLFEKVENYSSLDF
uniref:FYVE-type domain-containing protein n=1 Tax=Oryza barthii TaxID=65489 RepID=A0A0D3GHQ7_9ORYZ